MKTFLDLKASGLQTDPNNLSEVPQGSLTVADNVVIDRDSVVQQRRGIKVFDETTPSMAEASDTILFGTPINGSTVDFNDLPTEGDVTFTKVAAAPGPFEFVTIDDLTDRINNLTDVQAINDGLEITLLVATPGSPMNAATVTGTSSYLALSITFAGGGNTDGEQQLFEYNKVRVQVANQVLSYQDSPGLPGYTVVLGEYVAPFYAESGGDTLIRSLTPNRNMYLTTDTGVKRFKFSTAPLKDAGGVPGLDGDGATTGASGWMTDDTSVAYRLVWVYEDDFGTEIVGSPTQRVVVSNTSGGTRDVDLTFTIPESVTTDFTYKIYRSAMSATAATEPDDELKLVIQDAPSQSEVDAKVFTVTDSTPDSLRGEDLYTNSGQQGIEQSNAIPPICLDFCTYKGFTIYVNTQTQQRFFLTLLSVGAPDGIQVDDTVTVAGVTYTGKATENIAADQFLVESSLTPAENIDATARSLVRVINRSDSTEDVYAVYASGFGDLPGQILIFERGIGGSPFSVTASRTTCFAPELSADSSANRRQNGLYWSKQDQPEAVPLANSIFIGSADSEIQRCIALRDSVIIFKPEGIYRLTGETPPFTVSLLDSTIRLVGSNSPASLNNQIFCLTNQFVAAISETSVAIVSRPIEISLQRLLTPDFLANVKVDISIFGVGYETDRKYILGLPSSPEEERATQYYVYNTVTRTWTRWTLPSSMSHGKVLSYDDRLYLIGDAVYQERKDFSITDYADLEFERSIVSFSDFTVVLNSSTDLEIGTRLQQEDDVFAYITEIDDDGITVTVDREVDWDIDDVTCYNPISVKVTYAPIHAGNPGMQKIFQEYTCFFDEAQFDSLAFTFVTDNYKSGDTVAVMPVDDGGFGILPFGTAPFGTSIKSLQPIRNFFTRNTSRARWMILTIEHAQAHTQFALEGVAIQLDQYSPRSR